MLKANLTIMPDDRVMVYDGTLFRNDNDTPCSMITLPATVVRRYGYKYTYPGNDEPCVYPDCCDVLFDHRPEHVSHGHFTDGITKIA